jgi:hypothetical protein
MTERRLRLVLATLCLTWRPRDRSRWRGRARVWRSRVARRHLEKHRLLDWTARTTRGDPYNPGMYE